MYICIIQGNLTNGFWNGNYSYGGVCPAGYYCKAGTWRPYDTPCENGTYNAYPGGKTEKDCKLCDGGRVCNGKGLTAPNGECRAGWFCKGGAKSSMPIDSATGGQCTQGHYCPNGTSEPKQCEPGTFRLVLFVTFLHANMSHKQGRWNDERHMGRF